MPLEEMLNMSTILDIRNATVTYQDGESTTTALADASLIAESTTLTAIVGESGSGKSTLLSVAAGLITPDSGSVHVDGTRSIIFQQANLLSSLNVRDQLVIMDHIAGRKLRPQRADELLEFVGLAGMGNRRMGQLSGGQRSWRMSLPLRSIPTFRRRSSASCAMSPKR